VHLFREHRDMVERAHALEVELALERGIRAELAAEKDRTIASHLRTIDDLDAQLRQKPGDVNNLLNEFQDKILVELPFEGGKVPPGFWLTPGDEEPISDRG